MKRPLAVALGTLALAVGIYYAAFSGGGGEPRHDSGEFPIPTKEREPEPGPAATAPSPQRSARAAEGGATQLVSSVALWSADAEAPAPGARSAQGAGRGSALSGRVMRDDQAVAGAILRVVGGLNTGASATSDADGHYLLAGLYPGLTLVELEAPAQPRARREVALRRGLDETLDFECSSWGNVRGTVFGPEGKPLAGVRVELDGIVGETDRDGAFFFSGVLPGDTILYLSAPGYESRRELVPLRPTQALEADANRFILRRSEPLTVVVDTLPLGANPPLVAVLPGDGPHTRTFPFEMLGAVPLRPGDSQLKIDGIPVGESFQVRVYSDAGVASPGMRPVLLRAGDTNLSKSHFSFAWKSPLSGKVVSDGGPVAGARVRAESHDVARAMEEILRDAGGLALAALPPLPFASRETRTRADGSFRIEVGDIVLPGSVVIEAEGHERRVLPLEGIPKDLGAITLARRPQVKPGAVTVEFERRGAREVRVFVDGKPRGSRFLQSGERLEIEGILPGPYGIRVEESSDEDGFPVFEKVGLRLPGTVRVTIR